MCLISELIFSMQAKIIIAFNLTPAECHPAAPVQRVAPSDILVLLLLRRLTGSPAFPVFPRALVEALGFGNGRSTTAVRRIGLDFLTKFLG